MTKDQLLSLWNADNWEVMSCGVYFTAHRADKELHINCNDYTEAEILAMPFWERLAQELDELDRQAQEILQKEFPDDEDIPDLPLTDITIDKSGCCSRCPWPSSLPCWFRCWTAACKPGASVKHSMTSTCAPRPVSVPLPPTRTDHQTPFLIHEAQPERLGLLSSCN